MKHCSKCGDTKALSEFYQTTRGRSSAWCKSCNRQYAKDHAAKRDRTEYNNAQMKYYWTHRDKKLAYAKAYREKNKERMRKWSLKYYHENKASILKRRSTKKHKEYARSYVLRREYGITLEQYNQIRSTQNNKCAICKALLIGKAVVDHCHNTRVVRAILCDRCNVSIGAFKDDYKLLRSAYLYLLKHSFSIGEVG